MNWRNLFDPEELAEAQKHPFFKMPENFETFNELNLKIWNVYNISNSTFQPVGFFELVFNAYFNKLNRVRLQYVCNAFLELDSIVREHQEKQALKKDYEQKAKAKIK